MNYKQQLSLMGGMGTLLLGSYLGFKYTVFQVDTGHRAIKFSKLTGVGNTVYKEGYHLMLPWFERPIIYDVRTHP